MAGFGFSEEQEMFRREMQRFAQRELAPGAKERVKKESISREIVKKMADIGDSGLNIPEEYGGQPTDFVTIGIAVEELSKGDISVGVVPLANAMMSMALKEGTQEARQQWLLQFVRYDKLACFAISEPECGSDAAAIQMKAVRDQDYYIINGEKTSISYGMSADVALVFTKTDITAGARGVTTFIVPLNLPGITRTHFADMGLIPWGRASIMMEDVKVPVKYRIGEEGKGFYIAMHEFDFMRVILALAVLGLAESSLEDAMEYARQRKAFGRPIAKFEGVSFKIAEAATYIEAARLFCY
jgi:cyclohexanecarboxyl-CoA dehydrogenase